MAKILMVAPKVLPSYFQDLMTVLDADLERAREGVDALDKARMMKPDLILLNHFMPGMSSYETCKRLKGDPETEQIPVIFVSEAEPPAGEVVKSYDSGADDYLSFELDRQEVQARLQVSLRLNQSLKKSEALAQQLNELNTDLYERNKQVEKELFVARQLQQSLLPPEIKNGKTLHAGSPELEATDGEFSFSRCHYLSDTLRISAVYLPCDALGGDLYDVITFHNDTVGVTIADVSGHGVPAGFITAIYKASLYRMTHMYETASDILFHLNNELANIVKTGEYVTCVYCRLKENGRLLEYSGAGHPYPILYRAATGEVERLQENGTPLVWFKGMDYPMGETPVLPGDKILLFTDGISEMKNPEQELFGEERLEQLFQKIVREQLDAGLETDKLLDRIIESMSDFSQGHPLDDDLSLVLIEVL